MPNADQVETADESDQLFTLLVDSPDLDTYLDEVTRATADLIPPADGCGITVERDGKPFTISSSNAFAFRVDGIQYGAGDGPCLEALRTGTVVQVDDLATDERWDAYRAEAMAAGIASSLAVPLTVDGRTLATLNLYAREPAAFTGPSRRHALAFGTQCSAALRLVLRQARSAQLRTHFGAVMESRSVIDQAIGILMSRQGCTATTGFDALRRASQRTNRKLRDIAADLITRTVVDPSRPPQVR